MTVSSEKPNIEVARTVFHAGQALQVHRERISDLILDFLRTAPRPIGEDDHLVFAQVRNGIHRACGARPRCPTR